MLSADNYHAPNAGGIDLSLLSVAPNTVSESCSFKLDSPAPSAQKGKSEVHGSPRPRQKAIVELTAEQLAITIIFSFLSLVLLARVVCTTRRGCSRGNAEVEDKLKCRQKDHVEMNETISKKRAAALRDEVLFRQPDSSCYGDCPICFLPMPLSLSKSSMYSCCSKWVCNGCTHAMEQRFKQICPFCRKPLAKTDEEAEKMLMKRALVNDPNALGKLGANYCKEGEYDSAFKYSQRAAELGNAVAHFTLAYMYCKGKGVEKDEVKEIYHLEEAAIAGNLWARCYLGVHEVKDKRHDRAVKHFIIAANLGLNEALQALKVCYKKGHVSEDDLDAALRAHQAAVDATKSSQREAAEKN